MDTRQLTEQVMALPLSDRVNLAEALWQSIGDELITLEDRDAIETARRRAAELTSGAVAGRTHEDVMRALRQTLGCV